MTEATPTLHGGSGHKLLATLCIPGLPLNRPAPRPPAHRLTPLGLGPLIWSMEEEKTSVYLTGCCEDSVTWHLPGEAGPWYTAGAC